MYVLNNYMDQTITDQFINWPPMIQKNNCLILEELINNTRPENLDWQCISYMKYLSLDFIRMNFEYLDVNIMLNHQKFDEDFLLELIEKLLPKSGKDYDIFQILQIIYILYHGSLTMKFKSKYCCTKKYFKSKKNNKTMYIHKTNDFEEMINFIQENYTDEYNNLNFKAISWYKILSYDFILRHSKKLDLNIIANNQTNHTELIKTIKLVNNFTINNEY